MLELLSPWFLTGLILVPVVLLWGLLAPRARPVTVGSLMLWRRALGGGAVGRPSARVRLRDPLLWLDAGAVLLVVLAAARPAVPTSAPAEPVATIVLDRSASMAAAGGGPREFVWYNLRDTIEPILKSLDETPLRIVYVPDAAGNVSSETMKASELLSRSWSLLEPVTVEKDFWASVLSQHDADPDLPVVALTDVAPTVSVPRNVYVLATGHESRNFGLQRVAVRMEGNKWWLLVSAKAAPAAAAMTPLGVAGDDKVLASERDFVAAGAAVERVFPFDGPPPRQLEVGLVCRKADDDDFLTDNEAFMVLEPVAKVRVFLIGKANAAIVRALEALEGVTVVQAAAGSSVPAETDLVVAYEAAIPEDWKGPAAVIAPPVPVGPVAPTDREAPVRWDVAAAHPLASALYMGAPRIAGVRGYAVQSGAAILLGTSESPLAVTWEEGGVRHLAVLFAFDEKTTDWPQRAGFPVFWKHALSWLVPQGSQPAAYKTYLPFAPLPWDGERAPDKLGFQTDAKGRTIGVSFIGTGEGFRSGPGCDDAQAAVEAIRKSIEAKRRSTLADLWPYLAAGAIVVLLARVFAAR